MRSLLGLSLLALGVVLCLLMGASALGAEALLPSWASALAGLVLLRTHAWRAAAGRVLLVLGTGLALVVTAAGVVIGWGGRALVATPIGDPAAPVLIVAFLAAPIAATALLAGGPVVAARAAARASLGLGTLALAATWIIPPQRVGSVLAFLMAMLVLSAIALLSLAFYRAFRHEWSPRVRQDPMPVASDGA